MNTETIDKLYKEHIAHDELPKEFQIGMECFLDALKAQSAATPPDVEQAKWVRASERMPDNDSPVYCKIDDETKRIGNFYEREGVKYFHVQCLTDWNIHESLFHGLKWLDETNQSTALQEALPKEGWIKAIQQLPPYTDDLFFCKWGAEKFVKSGKELNDSPRRTYEWLYQAGQSAVQDATPKQLIRTIEVLVENNQLRRLLSEITGIGNYSNVDDFKKYSKHAAKLLQELSALRSELSAAQAQAKALSAIKKGLETSLTEALEENKKLRALGNSAITPPESGEQTKAGGIK